MVCPVPGCHSTNLKVTDTHISTKHSLIVRARKCQECGCKFHTEERIVQMDIRDE